jgi:hypothetical protein
MAYKAILRMLAVCAVMMVATAVSALAQDYKALLGKWNMTAETDGDPVAWILVLKEDGGRLTAVLGTGRRACGEEFYVYRWRTEIQSAVSRRVLRY